MTTILDCGYADLELLEDIKYDLDDIILELKKNNDLSFNNLLIDVFERGAMELKEEFNLQKDEIKQTISDLLQGKKDELISWTIRRIVREWWGISGITIWSEFNQW